MSSKWFLWKEKLNISIRWLKNSLLFYDLLNFNPTFSAFFDVISFQYGKSLNIWLSFFSPSYQCLSASSHAWDNPFMLHSKIVQITPTSSCLQRFCFFLQECKFLSIIIICNNLISITYIWSDVFVGKVMIKYILTFMYTYQAQWSQMIYIYIIPFSFSPIHPNSNCWCLHHVDLLYYRSDIPSIFLLCYKLLLLSTIDGHARRSLYPFWYV